MFLTLDMLLFSIKDLSPMVVHIAKKTAGFEGANYFISGNDCLPHYIYASDLSTIWNHRGAFFSDITIIASSDIELTQDELKDIPCNLILVDSAYSSSYLLNRLINTFSSLADWDKNMHISVLENTPLQSLIDMSEKILQSAIIIYDASFDVLGYTHHIKSTNPGFLQTISQGYTDNTVMSKVRKTDIISKLKSGDPLVAPAAAKSDLTNIYLAFYNNGTLLGYGCLFCDYAKPDKGYLDLLRSFSENISFCLKRDYQNKRFGQMMSETFLVNLMDINPNMYEQIENQIQNIDNLKLYGRFVLGTIAFEQPDQVPMNFLARALEREMNHIAPFIYQNQICLLNDLEQNDKEIDLLIQKDYAKLSNILEHARFKFGVSNVFYDIRDLKYAYEQSQVALSVSPEDSNRFQLYQDVIPTHLYSLIAEKMPPEMLQPEFYKELKSYDQNNHTDYLNLLISYIKNDCNATHTGKAMNVHRNTVRNVVQFTEDRWQVDLSNWKTKQLIMISFMIDDAAKNKHIDSYCN